MRLLVGQLVEQPLHLQTNPRRPDAIAIEPTLPSPRKVLELRMKKTTALLHEYRLIMNNYLEQKRAILAALTSLEISIERNVDTVTSFIVLFVTSFIVLLYYHNYDLHVMFCQLTFNKLSLFPTWRWLARIMMQYLAWRGMTGQHTNITLSFLVVGHTKFAPDWCFGLFKRHYWRTKVVSMQGIAQSSNAKSSYILLLSLLCHHLPPELLCP